MSKIPVVCRTKDDLIRQAWNSIKSNSVNDIIVLETEVQIHGTFGYRDDSRKIKEFREYTPLVIACMNGELELAQRLIEAGADINLRSRELKREEAEPPLYYALAARDADIVKLLLDSGVDVNGYIGHRQFIDLQKPANESYSIFPPMNNSSPFSSFFEKSPCMRKILELYLSAGVKLNTTFWGPCLFYGRGKVYETGLPTSMCIPGPYFICDTAIMLLQHGIDPDLYKLSDVLQQFSEHHTRQDCVNLNTLLQTFVGAGYHFTQDDKNCKDNTRELRRNGISMEEPLSLKQACRLMIRKHLRILSKDTSIFPFVDKLPIPNLLKEYLKLWNIYNLKNVVTNCRSLYVFMSPCRLY
ncbi:uncharacterized protein LOC133202548 [Saccostrea echinata]|uniref:uncharacterized protein LOC133202548 n=1 Tax=Saccostrea echinata TaxID=191078 RepID=UPI002A7F2B1D|nr:uncharacterized protein LOC133202548 [Saccostrea echinata]